MVLNRGRMLVKVCEEQTQCFLEGLQYHWYFMLLKTGLHFPFTEFLL